MTRLGEQTDPAFEVERELVKGALARDLFGSSHSRVRVGRFEIVRRLGHGAMGTVYEACDVERGARVALKTLHRVGPSAVYHLKREFRALADVAHPHRKAAEQYLRSGRLEQGNALARPLLARLGVRYPTGVRDATAMYLWERLSLRVHSLTFRAARARDVRSDDRLEAQSDLLVLYAERRLCALLGDHAGVDRLDATLRAQGVVNPERWLWSNSPTVS